VVCPAKAIELVDGSVSRVTPASSLRSLCAAVVDPRSGMPRDDAFDVHTLTGGGMAIPKSRSTNMYFTSDETHLCVFVGSLSPEARESEKAALLRE